MKPTLRIAIGWLFLLLFAFTNGAFRELFIQGFLGLSTHLAHQISCLSGAILLTGANLMIWEKLNITSFKQAAITGASWLIATALLETFLLNRNLSRAQILQSYDLFQGEFWGLGTALDWLHANSNF